MSQLRIIAATALCASAVGGCSFALNDARDLEPSGTAFARELHKGYVQLAQRELDENDFTDARAFALRARSAGTGKPEPPENLDLRKIPQKHHAPLTEARARLRAALDAGARTRTPRSAARAQLMFECWAQEQEENFQPDDIAKCRDGFETAMAAVASNLQPQKAQSARPEGGIIKASVSTVAPTPRKTRFTVLFDLDAADIKAAARDVIDQAIARAKVLGAAAIKVSGHADRVGPADYNRRLSEKRADAVASILKNANGSPRKIETLALGEDQPAVETPDGAKEPRNRRVEIELIE